MQTWYVPNPSNCELSRYAHNAIASKSEKSKIEIITIHPLKLDLPFMHDPIQLND